MSIDKKQIKMDYKLRRPEMGVIVFDCTANEKSYIGIAKDTKAAMNSHRFKLEVGMHPNKELMKDWKLYGESQFTIKVLEVLPYDEKDDAKTDYTMELEKLCDQWITKTQGSQLHL